MNYSADDSHLLDAPFAVRVDEVDEADAPARSPYDRLAGRLELRSQLEARKRVGHRPQLIGRHSRQRRLELAAQLRREAAPRRGQVGSPQGREKRAPGL